MEKFQLQPRDRGAYKEHPMVVPHMTLDEYGPKLKDFFTFKRSDNGILEAKWHTQGKELLWSVQVHRAIWQACMYIGQDMDNEVLILGGTGDQWIAGLDDYNSMNEEENIDWMTYEHMYYDGTNISEGLVCDIEIPTIGVINGPGFHTEMALFCDLTLMAEDAYIVDMHYNINMVPGDGIQIALRECMGLKRSNYMMLMGQPINAKTALEYGMVNEVLPREKIYDRAWEIAEKLMISASRATRRVTVQILRAPWKKAFAWELRHAFGSEMFTTLTQKPTHEDKFWKEKKEKVAQEMERSE